MSADTLLKRVALFKALEYNALVVFQQHSHETDANYVNPPGYVRVSAWQDVQFVATSNEDSKAIVDSLMAKRREIEADSIRKLNKIDGLIVEAMAGTPGQVG